MSTTQSSAQNAVLNARRQLTSSSGTRADFDFELMHDYADSRIGAAVPMASIVFILAIVASFWVPMFVTSLWAGLVVASLLIVVLTARRFKSTDPAKFNAVRWTTSFVAAESVGGLALSLLALFTLVGDREALAAVMFAMALVSIASNAVATHTLPPATLMSTLPVTVTVSLALVAQGGTLNYTLAAVAVCGEVFFVYLARQLHASELETISHQAEKDTLIYEMEEARNMSDEARRHAEQANIAKSQFLATMSHELRTPLTSIIGYAEMMELVEQTPDQRGQSVSAIRESGRHLLTLINDLLDLSRIEAGKYELDPKIVSLVDIADHCRRMMELRAKSKGIDIVFSAGDNLPKIWGDERAIRQVVLNLLSNAVKFTPQQGRVLLVVQRSGDGGQLVSVKDNGPGIPEDEIETVLSSFGQGSLAQKTEEQGAGLGLPIVQKIMDLHQGRFDLFSKLRFGTEVIATFPASRVLSSNSPLGSGLELNPITRPVEDTAPLENKGNKAKRPDARAPTSKIQNISSSRNALRVLVVEDDHSINHIITSIARRAGHLVTTTQDGESALDLLKIIKFDCVLLDMNLPGMRGTDVKNLFDKNKSKNGRNTLFFAVTADISQRQRAIYRGLGFRDVVEKPFSSEDILRVLSDAEHFDASATLERSYPAGIDAGHMARLEQSLEAHDFIESIEHAVDSLSNSEAALRESIEDGDLLRARKVCHTIAGTSGQFGLLALHQIAKMIGPELDAADASTMNTVLTPLLHNIHPSVAALKELRASC